MIITRYLIRETLKSQLAILFILLLIFFCQKLIRILEAAVSGDIPTNLILSVLGLGIPEMAQLILPLSLFLAIFMTYSRLYMDSEIIVMHACGISKAKLLFIALGIALITGCIAFINVTWLTAWSTQQQDQLIAQAKANPGLAAVLEGQFQATRDGNSVIYVESVKGNEINNIFLIQTTPSENARPSIIVAPHGSVERHEDGSQIIKLDSGVRYEGTAFLRDFRITDFANYQAILDYKPVNITNDFSVSREFLSNLWRDDSANGRSEFHWRLTLIASVFLMAILVVPLSEVNPRQGRVMNMLPAILLYLVYFLLQGLIRSNAAKGEIDPTIFVWGINLLFLLLGVALNFGGIPFIHRMKTQFMMKLKGNNHVRCP